MRFCLLFNCWYLLRQHAFVSRVRVAERLTLPTSNHEVPGSNSAGGGIPLMTTAPHCTEPSIAILPSSRYDLNNVERDVKHKIVIIKPLCNIHFLAITVYKPSFGSTVYNRVIVYKHQNFPKVVVHVIIIDQCNQTASQMKSSWLFIAALFLSLWRQNAVDRELSVKPGLGHWQTIQTQIKRRRLRRLISVWLKEIFLNPRSGPFFQPTLKDNLPTSAVSALINLKYCTFSISS